MFWCPEEKKKKDLLILLEDIYSPLTSVVEMMDIYKIHQ